MDAGLEVRIPSVALIARRGTLAFPEGILRSGLLSDLFTGEAKTFLILCECGTVTLVFLLPGIAFEESFLLYCLVTNG